MKTLKASFHFIIVSFCFIISNAQSWETLNATTLSWRFEDMNFINPDKGWVVDGGGQILRTDNGGLNWTQQFYDSDFYFRSVEFYNEQLGFAGTLANGNPNAQLLKTINGGQTWTDITTSLPVNIPGICGIAFADENTIFITGVFYGSAYIMKSENQGSTWQYSNMSSLANGLVDIYFKDTSVGWAVGQGNQGNALRAVILGTTNGGDTWTLLKSGNHSNQRTWKIQKLNDEIFYASIEEFEPSPQYFKSTDGGQNWELNTVETNNTSGTMQGIGFLNENLGWIGGFSNLFYETTNAGQTWEYQPTVGTSFNRFQRVNDTLMYGSGINVYRYADASLGVNDFEIEKPKGHSLAFENTNVIQGTSIILLNLVNNTFCELSIYNTSGQRLDTILHERKVEGDYRIKWNPKQMPSGQYYLVLYTYHGYEFIRFIVK